MKYKSCVGFAIVFATALLCGCARDVDLLPITRTGGAGPSSFCERDSLGRLVVTIKNQGLADAPDSTIIKLEFIPQQGALMKYMPAIPAGGNIDVTFDIPAEYYDPDCNFIIAVDVDNKIKESNEQNNRIDGICSPILTRNNRPQSSDAVSMTHRVSVLRSNM